MEAEAGADPHALRRSAVARAVASAAARLEADLVRDLPGLSQPVRSWMAGLSHTGRIEDYFLHPQAYPLVQLPFWLLDTIGAPVDDEFAGDLVYAALSGYCYLRLLDNLMDGHATVEREILPAANFFQPGAQRPFTAYFGNEHPFWERYRGWWLRFAEATWADGARTSIDRKAFEEHSADKTCPEKILIAAVCFRNGREELLPAWTGFAGAFGRWHQMGDDLRDWLVDFKAGRVTYFLSEAGRRIREPETVPGWVAREGYRWGAAVLDDLFGEVRQASSGLGCPALDRYLDERKRLSDERAGRALKGFRSLAGLQEILEDRSLK
jgi:hypothetical protein